MYLSQLVMSQLLTFISAALFCKTSPAKTSQDISNVKKKGEEEGAAFHFLQLMFHAHYIYRELPECTVFKLCTVYSCILDYKG